MLIITRKNGQKIMINDDIEITVVESRNGACKLAIQAPKSFKIYREEIYVQIKLANLMGQEASPALLDKASELLANKNNVKINTQVKTTDTDEEIIVKESLNKTGKTIVFGHFHTSWAHARDKGVSEFGDDAIWDIYRNEKQKIIGLDRCTCYTGEMNVLILEDDLMKGKNND